MDFSGLSDLEVGIVDDMFGKWLDYDRHGELQGSYGYDEKAMDAFYKLYGEVRAEMKKRRIYG